MSNIVSTVEPGSLSPLESGFVRNAKKAELSEE